MAVRSGKERCSQEFRTLERGVADETSVKYLFQYSKLRSIFYALYYGGNISERGHKIFQKRKGKEVIFGMIFSQSLFCQA